MILLLLLFSHFHREKLGLFQGLCHATHIFTTLCYTVKVVDVICVMVVFFDDTVLATIMDSKW